jgi:hypothetical protein
MDILLEKEFRLEQLLPLIQETLSQGKNVTFSPRGVSMLPMLRQGKDTVTLAPVNGKLKKYDLPLYKRGDQYILHRVIQVNEDSYVMRGDNCVSKEYGITDADIVGVMTAYYRKDRYGTPDKPGYRAYVFFWCHTHSVRTLIKRVYWKLKRKK